MTMLIVLAVLLLIACVLLAANLFKKRHATEEEERRNRLIDSLEGSALVARDPIALQRAIAAQIASLQPSRLMELAAAVQPLAIGAGENSNPRLYGGEAQELFCGNEGQHEDVVLPVQLALEAPPTDRAYENQPAPRISSTQEWPADGAQSVANNDHAYPGQVGVEPPPYEPVTGQLDAHWGQSSNQDAAMSLVASLQSPAVIAMMTADVNTTTKHNGPAALPHIIDAAEPEESRQDDLATDVDPGFVEVVEGTAIVDEVVASVEVDAASITRWVDDGGADEHQQAPETAQMEIPQVTEDDLEALRRQLEEEMSWVRGHTARIRISDIVAS